MKSRLLSLVLVLALLTTFVVPAFAPVAEAQTGLAVPISGTFTDALGGVGTFIGSFTPTRFVTQNGALAVVGTLTGTLTDSLGTVLGTVTRQITLPVNITQAACEILDLQLGPLNLDLLGLVVFLDEVNLEITAVPGAGNLLGNLLCAIAGLLDGNAALNAIVGLLNQILRAL